MKTWCRHIKWLPKLHGGTYWKSSWFLRADIAVPRNWKICPICQSERPTKANIAAAELRAAMDAGDEE